MSEQQDKESAQEKEPMDIGHPHDGKRKRKITSQRDEPVPEGQDEESAQEKEPIDIDQHPQEAQVSEPYLAIPCEQEPLQEKEPHDSEPRQRGLKRKTLPMQDERRQVKRRRNWKQDTRTFCEGESQEEGAMNNLPSPLNNLPSPRIDDEEESRSSSSSGETEEEDQTTPFLAEVRYVCGWDFFLLRSPHFITLIN
jgi:hypothetical protein